MKTAARAKAGPAESSPSRQFFRRSDKQVAAATRDLRPESGAFFPAATASAPGNGILAPAERCSDCSEQDRPPDTEEVSEQPHAVRRMPAFAGGDDGDAPAPIQRTPAFAGSPSDATGDAPFFPAVQPKLVVGSPDDPLESEADAFAERVVRGESVAHLARPSQAPVPIHRKCASCASEADGELEAPVQRAPAGDTRNARADAGVSIAPELRAQRGRGNSLPAGLRTEMEPRFGTDFSKVRLHDDSRAHRLSDDLGARAFTHGSDIYFGRGAFDGRNEQGKRLIAHELTHTIQQGASPASPALVQRQACPASNPPAEQPAEGQEPPDREERPQQVETRAGQSVEERQQQSPDPEELAPEPEDNIAAETEEAVPPADEQVASAESAVGGGEASGNDGAEGGVGAQTAAVRSARAQPAPGLDPEGLGEAASPEAAAERDANLVSQQDATALLDVVAARTGIAASAGAYFADLPEDRAARQSKAEGQAYLARRAEADSLAGVFVERAAAQVLTLVDRGREQAAEIGARNLEKRAAVEDTIARKRAQTMTVIAAQRNAAEAKAEQAIAQVEAAHATTIAGIRTRTLTATVELEIAVALARQQVEQQETAQLANLDRLYTDADRQYRAVGPRVGATAEQRANVVALEYEGRKTGRKDGFWDGYLTDNRWQARADAARETGEQYKEGLAEEADKQADAALEGKRRDVEMFRVTASETREAIDAAHTAALRTLEDGERQSIEEAEKTRARLLVSITESRDSTLASLTDQETSQLQFLQDYGIRQNLALERDGLAATTALTTGVGEAAAQLLTVLGGIQTQIAGMEAPPVGQLAAVISGLAAQFDGAVAQVEARVAASAEATARGLDVGADQAVQALETYSASGLDNARGTAFAFQGTIDTLLQGAMTGYSQLVQGHATTVDSTLTSSRSAFTNLTTGLEQAYTTLLGNLRTRFAEAVQQLERGLIGVLDQDLRRVICEQAEKAAREVQPWWKTALKILLVIVVIVVVALVLGPAVIGAVGAAAGALGASAGAASVIGAVVGGAIVGGLAGGVIQMGNNVIDGKDLMDGVGKAIVVGAIGGALGGAGGALAQGLANAGRIGAAGLMQSSMKFGIEAAFDVAGGVLGDLAVGNPITLEGVLVGAAIGGAVSISMANVGRLGRLGTAVEGVQTRSMAVGGNIGARAGRLRGGVRVGGETGVPSGRGPAPEAEPAAPRTTEQPAGPRPTEEGTAPRAGEEPGAPRAGEEPATRPDEEAGGAGREADPSQPGAIGPERSASGHDVTVLEDGTIVRCSLFCTRLENRYAVELANPKNADIAARLQEVQAMPPGRAKAKAAAEVEAQLAAVRETGEVPPFKAWDDPTLTREEFRADYAERNPNSLLTKDDLDGYFDEVFRVNPDTGSLKRPVEPAVGEPRAALPEPGSPADLRWHAYEPGGSKLPCFPPGTVVKTPGGDRSIESLSPGESVYAFDPNAARAAVCTVRGTTTNWTNSLVAIRLPEDAIEATANHPFWVEEETGFVRADQLAAGMTLRLLADPGEAKILAVERRPAQTATHNIEIDGLHTYFVGLSGVLVHNEDLDEASISKLADPTTRTARLYVIRDTTGKVIYVGQTFQSLDARYTQHLTDPKSSVFQYLRDNGFPELATNPKALANADLGRLLDVRNPRPPTGMKMTSYELSVWEQYYIDRHGGKSALENKINAITPDKIAQYRNLHNPCG